jgi:hypothetical protein
MVVAEILLYVGSVLIILWGIAHIMPTKSIVEGFGDLTEENRSIITMEWVAEGLALAFIGFLVLLITLFHGPGNPVSASVYRIAGVMLLIMAAWTGLTAGRKSVVFFKICPVVKSTGAVLFFVASVL